MHETSRRALLAVTPVAAAAALAGGAVVNAAVLDIARANAGGDDAELLSLKPRFDLLYDRWTAKMVAEAKDYFAWVAAIKRETGLADRPEIDWDDPDYVAWHAAGDKLHADNRTNKEIEREENLSPELDELSNKILSYRATTLDGVKLQTRAILAGYNDVSWSSVDYHEPDVLENPWLADFLESLCGVLDVPFPPYTIDRVRA